MRLNFKSIALASVLLCGCAGHYSWEKVPKFQPGIGSQNLMADQAGTYIVCMRTLEQKRPQAIASTSVFIDTGQRFGFRTDEQSHVIAYAPHQEFDLGPVSDDVKYLRWTTRQYVPPEIDPQDVADATGDLALAGAEAAMKQAIRKNTPHHSHASP